MPGFWRLRQPHQPNRFLVNSTFCELIFTIEINGLNSYDLTNYGSGVVKVKWSEYALATVIGIVPGLLTFVALGAALDLEKFRTEGNIENSLNPLFILLSVVIFIASILLSRWFKKRKNMTNK